MKQRTAKNVEQVRAWIETQQHHQATAEGTGDKMHMVLNNYHEKLRIPSAIWKQCKVKPGGNLDARMYRWDFELEMKELF